MSLERPDNRFLRLTTSEQSRELDRSTIEEFGIDSITLMEIAGKRAGEIIAGETNRRASGVFVCGKGNNAGDALVAARYLVDQSGHSVTLILTADPDEFSEDASRNFRLLQTLKENGADITIQHQVDDINWQPFDYAVDGLIGTGLTSELRSPMDKLVDAINASGLPVYAMDIPTGLSCDTGDILGTCVRADHTITFGTNKVGFYIGNGPDVTGSVTMAELPFPDYLRNHSATLIDYQLAEEFDPLSRIASHKYEKGTVHIVAGSEGMTGAAIMASKSAWNAGAGAVILYAPKGLLPVYEQALPEIIKVPVGVAEDVHFTNKHILSISEKISEKPGVTLIGPGLGLAGTTRKCVEKLLETVDQPVILDADGLSVWQDCADFDTSNWTLTPHPGELHKHLGIESSSDAERIDRVRQFASENGVRVLSKGHPTFLATPDGNTFITGYDTRLFARAGFGDVLAGTIAGKLAVSHKTDQSITDALLSIYQTASTIEDPQPGDIYDR